MHNKKDTIHNAVENAFRGYGYRTTDTSTCHGVLLDFIAEQDNKPCWFIEVKSGNKKLTENEKRFIREHPENSVVIRSVEEADTFYACQLAGEKFFCNLT